jgi:hypothetical protein
VLKSSQAATVFSRPPFGCTSGQALKGDLVYLPIFPTVETVGYFHSSGCAGLSTISDNQFRDNQFKSVGGTCMRIVPLKNNQFNQRLSV